MKEKFIQFDSGKEQDLFKKLLWKDNRDFKVDMRSTFFVDFKYTITQREFNMRVLSLIDKMINILELEYKNEKVEKLIKKSSKK